MRRLAVAFDPLNLQTFGRRSKLGFRHFDLRARRCSPTSPFVFPFRPIQVGIMEFGVAATDPIRQSLGSELCAACENNNVAQVQKITSSNVGSNWSYILVAAGREGASDVAAYALEQGAKVEGSELEAIITSRNFEPVYRLLVKSGAVDVEYVFEYHGQMLGYCATEGRHSLAQFLLEHGASPNAHDQSSEFRTALASAAVNSDDRMIGLLWRYGGRVEGSGALQFAAQHGKLENMKFLLDHGANVNEVCFLAPDADYSVRDLGSGK